MDTLRLLALWICGIVITQTTASEHNAYYNQRIKRDRRARKRPPNADHSGQATWRKTAIANRLFAHKLFINIARDRPYGNLIISPFVVSTGLSMALLGARGITETELMEVLEYSGMGTKRNGREYDKDDVPRLYQSLLRKTKSNANQGGYTLRVASKLFGEQTEGFLPEFIRDTEKYYDAKFEEVDFAGNSEGARKKINGWVSNKTQGVITEAVPPGGVSSTTLLTLVSTAYFKGMWKKPFDPENTRPGAFYLRDGTEITADFMSGEFTLLYKHSRYFGSSIVVIPYRSLNTNFTTRMELFLPVHPDRSMDVELSKENDMFQELRGLRSMRMILHLPKFRLDCDIDLRTNLERLGLVSLFGAADLSGMNGKFNLNIANAIHKSFIEVNEEGTTAGSALSLVSLRSSRIPEIRFDRPFFFIIRETHTNTVLFMGRVERPK